MTVIGNDNPKPAWFDLMMGKPTQSAGSNPDTASNIRYSGNLISALDPNSTRFAENVLPTRQLTNARVNAATGADAALVYLRIGTQEVYLIFGESIATRQCP